MRKTIAIIFGAVLCLGLALSSCSDSKLQSENLDSDNVKILIDTVGFGMPDTITVPSNDTLQHSYMLLAPQETMYEVTQVIVFHPYIVNSNSLRNREHIKQNSIRNNC